MHWSTHQWLVWLQVPMVKAGDASILIAMDTLLC